MISTSTPTLVEFDPRIIPFQRAVIRDMQKVFDYRQGVHEILLSGSVGSAKTILMAHIVVVHCLSYPGARVLLGRHALPDLKSTIYAKIVEHIDNCFVDGADYTKHDSSAFIRFSNGSQIISRSWADNRFSKVRSLELSAACIEELTESDNDQAYNEIKMRVGRLPHVKQNFIICATNPAAPSHWAYKYFIAGARDFATRHVYYSRTEDNPFLPPQYVAQLKRDLDPKLARRMLYGEWIELSEEVIYYQYDQAVNFRDTEYVTDPKLPIWLSWDFNIGQGKPLSVVAAQMDNRGVLHAFKEFVVEGMRTSDSFDEIVNSGLLQLKTRFLVTGDAAGRNRDTRSVKSDFDILKSLFSRYDPKIDFEMRQFLSNPPIRTRHNMVNAYCKNLEGAVRLYVYKPCKVLDEGLRLTAFKKNSSTIEDDSKHYQHITTALGYLLHAANLKKKQNENIVL